MHQGYNAARPDLSHSERYQLKLAEAKLPKILQVLEIYFSLKIKIISIDSYQFTLNIVPDLLVNTFFRKELTVATGKTTGLYKYI